MSSLKKETTEKQFDYDVKVDWNNQNGFWWNETCAMVLEVFGLPGSRFVYVPHEDYMIFKFTTEKDEKLCRILLSERL
jgi:hypothetical protein